MKNQIELDIANVFSVFSLYFSKPISDTWSEATADEVWEPFHETLTTIWGISYSENSRQVPRDYKTISTFYNHHLTGGFKDSVLPIESVYKQWTVDRTCHLPFAKSTGYVMGDPAVHIQFLLEQFQIQLSDEFQYMPDHITILLELLSYLYQYSNSEFILDYLNSHFDWIEEFERALLLHTESSSFYLRMTELLIKVINQEKARLERELKLVANF